MSIRSENSLLIENIFIKLFLLRISLTRYSVDHKLQHYYYSLTNLDAFALEAIGSYATKFTGVGGIGLVIEALNINRIANQIDNAF